MDSLNQALSEYSAYFGIVVAFLSLVSWLVSNYFGDRAKAASESLRQAQSDFRMSQSLRRIYSLINEETQTLDHVYRDVRDLSEQLRINGGNKENREAWRYNALMRLSYIRHGDRAVFSELERANQLSNLVRLLDLHNDSLTEEATKVSNDIHDLYTQREKSQSRISGIISSTGDIYQIDDNDWSLIENAIKEHRELTEIKLIPEQNRISTEIANLESKILTNQQQELVRRNHISRRVKRLAFFIYITSALIALYGKWLEIKYPRISAEQTQVTPAFSG